MTLRRRVTGSGLDRAKECPASYVLPAIFTTSEAAERGTAIHKWLERPDEPMPDKYRQDCEAINLAKTVPTSDGIDWREAAFVFDPATRDVRRIEARQRDYSRVPKTMVTITLDRIFEQNGALCVVDYKTGRDAPSVNTLQLGLGAFCAARMLDRDEVRVAIVHIPPESDTRWHARPYDLFELEEVAIDVAKIHRSVVEANETGRAPDVTMGAHCQYCPCKPHCPSMIAFIEACIDGNAEVDITNVDSIGDVWTKWEAAKVFLESLEKQLKSAVDRYGSVPIGGDKAIKPIPITRKSLVIDKATAVFDRLGMTPPIKRSMSNTDVEAEAKRLGIDKKRLWLELVEADAVKMADTVQYRKVKA